MSKRRRLDGARAASILTHSYCVAGRRRVRASPSVDRCSGAASAQPRQTCSQSRRRTCIASMCTAHAPHVHTYGTRTARARHTHMRRICTRTAHARHTHGTCTAHARHTHGTCTARARHEHVRCASLSKALASAEHSLICKLVLRHGKAVAPYALLPHAGEVRRGPSSATLEYY